MEMMWMVMRLMMMPKGKRRTGKHRQKQDCGKKLLDVLHEKNVPRGCLRRKSQVSREKRLRRALQPGRMRA
jgi:hypothetical protein